MIEKTRIQRAMVRLDCAQGFTAKDLTDDTAAELATVRQTIARSVRESLAEPCGCKPSTGRGGPEKRYRLTSRGRQVLAQAASRIYAALLTPPSGTEPDASLTVLCLQACLRTLAALRDKPHSRMAMLERLDVAEAEAEEAARDTGETGHRALRLLRLIEGTRARLQAMDDDDQAAVDALATALHAQIDEAMRPSLLDQIPELLVWLRREAARAFDGRNADARVGRVVHALLGGNLSHAGLDDLRLQCRAMLDEPAPAAGQEMSEALRDLNNCVSGMARNLEYLVDEIPSGMTDLLDALKRDNRQPEIDAHPGLRYPDPARFGQLTKRDEYLAGETADNVIPLHNKRDLSFSLAPYLKAAGER